MAYLQPYEHVSCHMHNNHKRKHTIAKILDEMWNMISNVLPREKPEHTIGRRPQHTIQKSTGWYSICSQNRMPVENASRRIWFWLNLPQGVSAME